MNMSGRWVLTLVLAVGLGCGDDEGPGAADAAASDAAPGAADAASSDAAAGAADAGLTDGSSSDGIATDAPSATRCAPTEGLYCDSATQICVVKGPVGPANTSSCQPVPSGCEGDRTCGCVAATLCEAPFDTCSPGEVENAVFCECLTCQ